MSLVPQRKMSLSVPALLNLSSQVWSINCIPEPKDIWFLSKVNVSMSKTCGNIYYEQQFSQERSSWFWSTSHKFMDIHMENLIEQQRSKYSQNVSKEYNVLALFLCQVLLIVRCRNMTIWDTHEQKWIQIFLLLFKK